MSLGGEPPDGVLDIQQPRRTDHSVQRQRMTMRSSLRATTSGPCPAWVWRGGGQATPTHQIGVEADSGTWLNGG